MTSPPKHLHLVGDWVFFQLFLQGENLLGERRQISFPERLLVDRDAHSVELLVHYVHFELGLV